MNNYFLTEKPYSITSQEQSFLVGFVNKGMRFFKTSYQLSKFDINANMNTVEQRINYYHLLDAIITYNIPGEVVDLGCFTGQCAVLFQKVIEQRKSEKQLHLYDNFSANFKHRGSVEDELTRNFERAGLRQPIVHNGNFTHTLPGQLPEKIAFAHIDCGFGGDKFAHKAVVLHCLESIYPRMAKDSICIMMDYYDTSEVPTGLDTNPGVKLAYDEFFTNKPEQIICLYGNQYNHAYFRKS